MIALGALSTPARALDVHVASPQEALTAQSGATWIPPARGDSLFAGFRIEGTFEENSTLGDGIAATLLLVVDLWRERSGWWDVLVQSGVILYRFRRDVWTERVELLDQSGRTYAFSNREALQRHLESPREIRLGVPGDFEKGRAYYITVKALVRPLSLEDLESVDAWLSGKVTGSEGKGILGVPKAVARALLGASGLGDETAVGRSHRFVPRP